MYKAGSWEVMQQGGASLTQMWDGYRASEDPSASEAYASTLISLIRGVCGPLVRKCLALSEETLQVAFLPIATFSRCQCMSRDLRLTKPARQLFR